MNRDVLSVDIHCTPEMARRSDDMCTVPVRTVRYHTTRTVLDTRHVVVYQLVFNAHLKWHADQMILAQRRQYHIR